MLRHRMIGGEVDRSKGCMHGVAWVCGWKMLCRGPNGAPIAVTGRRCTTTRAARTELPACGDNVRYRARAGGPRLSCAPHGSVRIRRNHGANSGGHRRPFLRDASWSHTSGCARVYTPGTDGGSVFVPNAFATTTY